jgi:dTDP-4-dehydrorhamnose 3,5-epimerase-like enzyme
MSELWRGLTNEARAQLTTRDYSARNLAEQLATAGVPAGQLLAAERATLAEVWIPGVELFRRVIYPQRHRGLFGELARQNEGALTAIGMWPKQWAAARMFAGSAKGFHVHPPSVPNESTPEAWMRRQYVEEPHNFSLRRYAEEQWDTMFFVQGRVEMLLRDLRAGLPARTMRLWIDGDDHPGANNAGVIIPPGVAHAIRVEGSEDAIMVYGTSVSFDANFEGRIASDVETSHLPQEWQAFLGH